MEQYPISIAELLAIMLYLGSITYLLGIAFQIYILLKNKKTFIVSLTVIILTRVLTIISSYFIWKSWPTDIDDMLLFLFFPTLISEMILSPLILIFFKNHITLTRHKNTTT
jgi:hypothetical protein